jgi:hypothetical protein
MTGAPRAGSSTGALALGAARLMTRHDHQLAPRPALVRATMRGGWPCPRSTIVLRTSSGSVARDRLLVRHRPTGVPLRSQDGAASLELIHRQQFIVASQRVVIKPIPPAEVSVLGAHQVRRMWRRLRRLLARSPRMFWHSRPRHLHQQADDRASGSRERELRALQDKLMRKDFFEEFCREFAKEMNRLRWSSAPG